VSFKDFENQVIDLAHIHGWRVAHFPPVQIRPGVWITPVKADGKGFLDLLLLRHTVIAAELKTGKGRPTVEQIEWLEAWRRAGVDAYLWHPDDLEEIQAVLAKR
jgi:hypothetical protein